MENAGRVAFLTGAGLSAESGVPTFRGDGGLWKSYRPEELATPEAFRRDPRMVWEWYAWRRELVSACRPNAGHRSIARFALGRPGGTTVITQNVDGLHRMAALGEAGGEDPEPALPLELHGALFRDRCSGCGARAEPRGPVDASSASTLPRCVRCGSLLRPDVVWFGEALDPGVLASALDGARDADVCVVVGTSALIHPAALVPLATKRAGGTIVEVNTEDTPLTRQATVTLRGSAARLLPDLLD